MIYLLLKDFFIYLKGRAKERWMGVGETLWMVGMLGLLLGSYSAAFLGTLSEIARPPAGVRTWDTSIASSSLTFCATMQSSGNKLIYHTPL